MGVLQQCRLLLGKNFLLRWRHPGILVLEVIWPVLIIAVVALIRVGVPPNERETCHYQDRAMPSAGLVPFMQTFVCNLDNKCLSNDSRHAAEANSGSISSLVQKITPHLSDEGTLGMLGNVDDGLTLITSFSSIITDGALMEDMDNITKLSHYFRDPEELKRVLVQDYNFSQDAVGALMDSQANISAILELSEYPDLKGVACDPERLRLYLYFPEGTNVTQISRILCDINDTLIPQITDLLQRQLDIAEIIRLLGIFENVKARLSKDYTWANGLRDVADMMDLLFSIGDLAEAVKEMSAIKDLPDILRSIPRWVEGLQASQPVVDPLEDMIHALDPLISEVFPNDTMWMSLKDATALGAYIIDLVNGGGASSNSSAKLMQSMGYLMKDVLQVFRGMPPDLLSVLDSLSYVDWLKVVDLMTVAGSNDTAIWLVLEEVQQALERSTVWTDIAGYLPLATDLLHSVNLMLHEIMEASDDIQKLMSGEGPLKQTMEQLLGKGPNVTLAVLKAFTHPNTLAKLLADGGNYSAICTDVIAAVRGDIGQVTANQLTVTLCQSDASTAISSLLGGFDIHNITVSLDHTINTLMAIFSGNTTERPASLPAMWQEISTMMDQVEQISSTSATSWTQLFSVTDVLVEMMGNHSREWEPVVDMLNENFLGSSILSLFGAAGRLMNDSASAQWMQKNLGPMVHMTAHMMEGVYTQLEIARATYSKESPLGQLAYYSTNYAPQIVTGMMDMPSNGNAEMMYRMVSSEDPMAVFCGDHMMQHMGLSHDVAISIENVVCLTNWTQVGDNVLTVQNGYSVLVQDMMTMMANMNSNSMTTSLEADWADLSYYTSLVMDLMSEEDGASGSDKEQDPLQMLEAANSMNQGPWSLLNYFNYSQVGVAVGMAMDHMQNLTTQDLNFFVTIAGLALEKADQAQSAVVPTTQEEWMAWQQWRLVKHYFRIVDDLNIMIKAYSEQAMVVPNSLSSMLEQLPEELKHMVSLAAGAYLELIDAMKNIILKPEQLISKIATHGAQVPNCGNVTVASYWLMLAPDSSFARLEQDVCTANWTDISAKMVATTQTPAVTEATADMMRMLEDLDKLLLDPVVNWTRVINGTVVTVQGMLTQLTTMPTDLSTFDLLPFNMTAINTKWAQFYKDMEQLQNMDTAGLIVALQELQNSFVQDMLNQLPGNNAELLRMLNSNVFITQHVMQFLNVQLRYMRSHSEVNVLDMLGSEELRKVAQVLRYSPEINHIGVNTLLRMISDPAKAAFSMDLPSLCTNLTLFSHVVAVNDSIISTPLLQQTVCNLNVNGTLLLHELQQNWRGFSDLVDAFELLMQPNATLEINTTAAALDQKEFTELLNSLTAYPPTFTFFDSDRWMNASLYEGPWKKLGQEMEKLYQTYQDPSAIMSNLQSMLRNFAAIPEMQSSLLVLDAVLDAVHMYTSSMGVPESFENYPNMETFYSLLDKLPELLEMLAYTTMQHPEQLNNWAGAMTSWETFCGTDPTTLMTAPSRGGLDVRKVFEQMCSINITQLGVEFNTYQGLDRLNVIMAGGNLTEPLNVTALAEKMGRVLKDFESMNATLTSGDTDMRFLNASVWAAVFARLGQDFNQTVDKLMSPEAVLKQLYSMSNIFEEFKGLQMTAEQLMAITDVVLDQILQSMKGGSLKEMFSQYPMVTSAVGLLDRLPEIYETLAYTGLYTPEKLMEHFTQMMTFDTFCSMDISLILTAPPGSHYNLTSWQHTLCSINVTVMLEELGQYQGIDVFMPNASVSVNLTSISEKLEKVIDEFRQAASGDGSSSLDINNYFNLTAWEGVMQRLQTWMEGASQVWSSTSVYKKLMSAGILSNLQTAIPEVNTALTYTSAILDLFLQQLERSTSSLSVSFAEYPHMSTMLSLLEEVPEIFEMFAYTTLYHQEQLARWAPAMASWEMFCSYDPNSLLTAPPGSKVSVSSVLQRLCSINVTELMIELNQYQGMEKLEAVMSGSVTEMANTTAVAEQLSELIDSMAQLFTTPMESGFNLHMFNQTVWEQVFQRLGQNLSTSQQQFMSPATIMDFYDKLFGGFAELNDTQQTMNKVWAVMDIVLDQMLRSFQGGNLADMLSQYPTMQSAVSLLDHLPEIYETVMYTALYAPDKVIARVDAFSSLETFCSTDMSTMFTVPDGVTFDLTAWQTQFCSLNLTVLMVELAQYQGQQDIANIFSPNSTVTVNMTSVVQKIEMVINKLSMMNDSADTWQTLNARFLNSTLWELANSNVQNWVSNPNNLFWMRPDRVMLLYADMLKDPNVTQDLAFMQPVFSVMSLLMDKLFLYENKTTMTLEELLIGAPELQKFLHLIQEPGVIEVLLESLNSEKFAPVLRTNNITTTFIMLCYPGVSLDRYLTVPAGVTIDLTSVKAQLCSIDLQQFPLELMEFFDIERFAEALNGSLPVDYLALSQQYGRLSTLIERWVQSPPVVTLPARWLNETFWLQILERYGTARQDTTTIFEELERFTDSLGPLMTDDPMRQVGLVAQTVLRLLSENLLALQGQNLTLENLVQHVPVLHDVFSALGVEGDILNAMMKAPVQSSSMLLEALLADGTTAQDSVCNITRLQELLQLPVSFNTTALYQAVCLKDTTEAVNNLVRNLDLQELIDGLQSPVTAANWSEVFQQSEELQKHLEAVIAHPPTFNASSLMAMLDSAFNTSSIWQMMSMFNNPELFQMLAAFPEMKIMEDIFRVNAVLMEFLTEMVDRLVVDGVTLDLASLFSSSPSFVRLMDAALHARPDVVTALASVQFNPTKINEFMNLTADTMQSIMCSHSEFQKYFIIADNVNITEILDTLCSLNFTLFVDELSDNFMVEALAKKLQMAMNSSAPIDIQKYVKEAQSLVEEIMKLGDVKNVTFHGTDLQDAFNVNATKLWEAMELVNGKLLTEYSALSSFSLNSALASIITTYEGQSTVLALKIIELYLHSFNIMLQDISSGPITLATILNNTEVGNIVIPFLQNPQSLEELLNLKLLPQQLGELLMRDDAVDALCGPELFHAFAAPDNESAVLEQLQGSVCGTNVTVMMWQAIMGQANGYQLYLQIGALSEEVASGRATVNVSAIDSDVQNLIQLVTQLVMEYQNGTRSADDLLDWRAFEDIFNRFSSSIGEKLMNVSQDWSVDLMKALMPTLQPNDPMSINARTINTVNIFMDIINDRLEDMIKNGVSLYTLLNNSASLVNLMEAYLDVTRLTPQGWLDNQFNLSRVVEVSTNNALLMNLCTTDTLSAYLADGSPNTTLADIMQTVMCSVTTELPEAFRQFIDYQALQTQLTALWNMSLPVEPQYQQYVDNTARFSELITKLATTPPTVDPNLSSKFDFTSMLESLQNIATQPEMIFRLLKALSIVLDGPAATNDLQNTFYGIDTYVAQTLLSLVENMDEAGVSLTQVMQDPSKLLEAVPVLMNFNLQFDVLTTTYLQPAMNRFWNNEIFRNQHLCNGQLPEEVFTSSGVDRSVVSTLCTIPSTEWIQTLKEHNYTEAQIISWVKKVEDAYQSVPRCYTTMDTETGSKIQVCTSMNADLFDNKGMYWMRLMTTLESVVSHLVPKDDKDSAVGTVDSLTRMMDLLKDAFLNKTLQSAMNYLEAVDRMGEKSQEWLVFKQIMSFLQSAGELLNSGLHRATDGSGTISLQKLLPDSQKLADILGDLLGPTSAAEMLTASINPELFYELSIGNLQRVACDPIQFSSMFKFPTGTNVTAVQVSLCEAATQRASRMQELIDLFQAGDVLMELDQLVRGNYSSAASDMGLWQALHTTVSDMLAYFEQIQNGQLDASMSQSWLDPILQQLTNLNEQPVENMDMVCRSYVAMIGGTTVFQASESDLVFMSRTMAVAANVMPMIPKLDGLVCAMTKPDGLDLVAGVNFLRQNGLDSLLESVSNFMENGTKGEFQCSELLEPTTAMLRWVQNLTQPESDFNMERLGYCLEQGSRQFATVLDGFNQLYQVVTDMSHVLSEDDLGALLHNSGETNKVLNFILTILSQEKTVILQFADLLSNSTDVQTYLTNVMKLTPEAVTALLESTIQLNASNFLNYTVPEIVNILCDPAHLDEVMTLPDFSPFDETDITDMLCTEDVNITAGIFKDAAKTGDVIAQLMRLLSQDPMEQFASTLTNDLVTLVSQLQSVTALMDMLGSGFDINFIMENADTIDAILAGGGTIQKIVESLTSLVETLKYMVPSEYKSVITDIQTFIKGLLGIDLVQSYLVEAIQVSDLQQDPGAVRQYLIDGLGFSPEAASTLLSSTFSIRVFLNASGLVMTTEPCEERLPRFILMNSTEKLEEEVTSKFCTFNSTQLTDFMRVMVPQLDIGTLLQKYITYSGNSLLESMNLTKSEAKEVFESLSDGSQNLQEATVFLLEDDSSFSALLSNVEMTAEGNFDKLTSLQPALCGMTNMEVNDDFNLNSKIQGDPTPQDLIEEAQLEGEFCKELYRSVKSSRMGAVAWAYIKPIMSGKILYTPDTPATRKIIANANWVFDAMSEVRRVSKVWSEKVPSLLALNDADFEMAEIKAALSNSFVQGILKSTIGVDPNTLTSGLEALGNNSMNTSSLSTLQTVAELIYNYTTCVDLNRFEAMATEQELERRAFQLYENNTFLGGIVFMNMNEDGSRRKKRQADNDNLPPHVMYKIRMDMDNVPTTNRLKNRLWMPDAEDNFASDLRYMRGFIQLQDMMEGAILRLQTNDSYHATGVSMQQMPYPCHTMDDYIHYLGSYLLPILMTFAWLAAIGVATHNLVYDRQSGQEESLRIMGMISGMNVLAWFVVTVLIMAVVSLIITIIFKYSGVFTNSSVVLVFLFFLDFCVSTTALCYFISAFFSRVTLAILSVIIIYFMSYLPYIILVSAEVYMTHWQKSLACLSSTTAFGFGAIFVTRFEEEMEGLQWSNVNNDVGDSVTFSWICYMMLIDSAIYMVLGWYIRNVKPGKYGVSQPWYFPVLPSYWCACLSTGSSVQPMPRNSDGGGKFPVTGLFEADPQGLDVGVSIRDLKKTFKGKDEVVHGISVNIYHDQITTLLGHNGAAKTTTLHMLVGVLAPSDGEVLVEGQKTRGCTGLLGLCPQHNTLFEYMTVKEHMEFYGGVKGHLSSVELQREIRKLLNDVSLWHVKDIPAKDLSGGMQRRLCVAMAFAGGSKTIILDEPTSGVDPHARKNIWNLILKNRPGRTIVMSTHHLDEADMLSDRILIMHTGRLLSVGSPNFLKNQLGVGYKLTINTTPALEMQNEVEPQPGKEAGVEMSSQHGKVMAFIQAALPLAKFKESVGTDLTVGVPSQSDSSAHLSQFFRQLDGQKAELGVLSYGVSNTTLEEVFLQLTTEADAGQSNGGFDHSVADSDSVSSGSDNAILRPSSGRPKPSVKGASLKFQQFGALLLKRIHHYRRNWRMLISTLVLPLLAFLCAIGFSVLRPTHDDMRDLIMSPALYAQNVPNTYAFVQDNTRSPASKHFMDTLMADFPGIGTTCMEGFDAGSGFKCVTPSGMHQSEKKEQVCRCDDYHYQCTDGPQQEGVEQMLTRPDITLQDLTYKDLNLYLVDSYINYLDRRFGGWSLEPPEDNSSQAKVWFNNKGYHAIPSYFNALSNNLLRAAVSSSESHKYGITLYNHPLMLSSEQLSSQSIEESAADVGIAMVILMALSFIPSAFMVYMTNEKTSQEKHLQSISGVGTLLYWLASFFWDMVIYSCVLAIMVIIVVIFKTDGFYDRDNLDGFALLVFLYGWAVIPAMYCTLRFFSKGSSAYLSLFCTNMLLGLLPTICIFVLNLLDSNDDIEEASKVLKYIFLIFPQYSLGIGLVDLVANQVQFQLLKRFGEDTYVDPFDFKMLGWNFVVLAAEGLLFFLLAIFIHSRKEIAVSMSGGMHYNAANDDEDVYHEQEKVHTGDYSDSLAVKGLCKVYRQGLKKFCAVNNLSFGVGKGECFGLLGVNGAGKTTTFKMLTGATAPSGGDAIIQQRQLSTLRSKLGNELGYCPQEDALDMYLSGRETLTFHARLRGYGSDQVEALVSEQLKRLHLESLADKAVRTYSGGNKRKLSLAVAMLGDAPLLLLDEPTTGMDAATRRLAWKCITTATQRGQSVLLTSHSMNECDALCSRLAIMVNGQLKCVGSPQHLKYKFGDGYTVVLHLQGLSSSRYNVAEAFLAHFPGSVIKVSLQLKDQHHSVLEVSIPCGAGSVADVFDALRDAQAQHHIMYYSVSQTTLDSVFVNFAREQSDHCDLDMDEDSSSGASTSDSTDKDVSFQKSMVGGKGTFAYMNPQYSGYLDSLDPSQPPYKPSASALGSDRGSSDTFITKL